MGKRQNYIKPNRSVRNEIKNGEETKFSLTTLHDKHLIVGLPGLIQQIQPDATVHKRRLPCRTDRLRHDRGGKGIQLGFRRWCDRGRGRCIGDAQELLATEVVVQHQFGHPHQLEAVAGDLQIDVSHTDRVLVFAHSGRRGGVAVGHTD